MNQVRDRLAFGMLTGCLALFGACMLDEEQQDSERTDSTVSEVLVQSCPSSYGSCASWSTPQPVGAPYCSYGTGQCGFYCDPIPGRPSYCDWQIIPADECCNWAPNPETYVTMESYQVCWDIQANSCVKIDHTPSFAGCGC